LPDAGTYAPADINTFGKDIKNKLNFGSKYEFKPNNNPAPGSYDVDAADKVTKATTRGATIKEPSNLYRRPAENQPDPGSYAPKDLNMMGKGMKNVTMGSKYEFKPNKGPAPGQYDADKAIAVTKPKTRGAVIREDVVPAD